MEKNQKRDLRLDIIRLFALFTVVAVHFFLNIGYYENPMAGKTMLVSTIIRNFLMICVPLFMTLTGYLMNKKELSTKYYKGLLRIIATYLICSIIYFLYEIFYLKMDIGILTFIFDFLSFKGVPTAWYIEMYIGLFILIPFLNMIINNLKNQKQFKILLLTLLILISLPGLINIYRFDSIDWWLHPITNTEYTKIMPAWWTGFYPVLYYFLGAYIKKYSIEEKTPILKSIIILTIVTIINGLFTYYRSDNALFFYGPWTDHYSLFVFIQTYIVFNLLLKIKIKPKSPKVTNIFKVLSNAVLGAYLISYIFDNYIYGIIINRLPNINDRFIYFPIFIISFILSIISAILIEQIRLLIFKILKIEK